MFQNNTKAKMNLAAAEVKADIMKFFAKWDVANCERLGKIEKEIEMFGRKNAEIQQLKSRVELLEERNLKLHARLKKIDNYYENVIAEDQLNLSYEPIKFTQTLKVGDWIQSSNRDLWRIRKIDQKTFEATSSGEEGVAQECFKHSDDWELVNKSETTKKKLLAPALKRLCGGKKWQVSTFLYASTEEAERDSKPSFDVIWPALPNKDGFYELPGVNDD